MGGGAALAGTTGLQIAGGATSAYGSYLGGQSRQQYFDYLSDTAKSNAGLAQTQAQTRNKQIGVEAGFEEAALSRRISETTGAQRAAVSTGAGSSSRTAQDIIGDTLEKGNIDEMAIRWNTAMRSKSVLDQGNISAFNFMNQAAGYGVAGKQAKRAGNLGVATSILGTGSSVASDWTRYNWGGSSGGTVAGTV